MKLYITFGQKYRREPNPKFPDAHPDGWVEVIAPTYDKARSIAIENLGTSFACAWKEDEFMPELYPLGRLAIFGESQ